MIWYYQFNTFPINGEDIEWKTEICYLGVTLKEAANVKCSLTAVTHKFVRALNGSI
jgi:hypothetical protein